VTHSKSRFLALSLFLLTPLAQAELIKIPVGQQTSADTAVQLPHRGASTAAVTRGYGEPAKRGAAVGEPPISRWEYPGFAVYFEYDHVVHAVRIGTASPVAQLAPGT
jgi:hypothetical protein